MGMVNCIFYARRYVYSWITDATGPVESML
jgi:hypothetical protein